MHLGMLIKATPSLTESSIGVNISQKVVCFPRLVGRFLPTHAKQCLQSEVRPSSPYRIRVFTRVGNGENKWANGKPDEVWAKVELSGPRSPT